MRKILLSLAIIGIVAGITAGITVSYFSDTETSTGNTFTAGSIDLKIDNECFYNGQQVSACTWGLTDLDGHLFFSFLDLKPGDWGEDTISLHVYNNDAWACMRFKDWASNDNTCTEPESAEDPDGSGCWPNNSTHEGHGELDEYLYFVFWADMCSDNNGHYPGDNVYTPNCDSDKIFISGKASNIFNGTTTYPIADNTFSIAGNSGTPLTGSVTYHIGKMWCFGNLNWSEATSSDAWTCDGSQVGNASQTDSLTGTIEFYAVQARNNPNFQCTQ